MTGRAGKAILYARTVTGDLPASELGRVDAHEHLLMRLPQLEGDELDDPELSAAEVADLRAAGIDTIVELTPIGCGRDPVGLRDIAERTGTSVIAATGVHREAHYPAGHWSRRVDVELLERLFVRDITEGCDANDYCGPLERPTDIRAGIIKIGAGYWSVSEFEQRVFEAAAAAHQVTGAPIVCHLERGTAAFEVGELLTSQGVPSSRVAFAHVDRNPDPGHHAEIASAGFYLQYDGMARAKYWPDSVILDCLLAVAETGYADRLLLGGDVARRRAFRSYGGHPGMSYLPRRFVPRLRAAGGEPLVTTVLVRNPARLLAFVTP